MRFHHSDHIIAVIVVHKLDHTAIAIDAGKVISPQSNAARAIIPKAPLDCIITVTTIHNIPNHHKLISLYCVRSNVSLMTATLSFIQSNPTNKSQNQTSNLAARNRFSFLRKIIPNHQIAIRGNARSDILNSPNQISAAKRGNMGDQMFAPKITQMALWSCITPAPTKARINKLTRLLLCMTVVVHVHVQIAIHHVLVCFCNKDFSFFQPRKLSACSKMLIP